MSRAGPPGGSCVNLSAGPSVSDIISRRRGGGPEATFKEAAQPRVHPAYHERTCGPCRKTTARALPLFLLSPFHPPLPSFSRRFLFISSLPLPDLLIYPWTRHISYPPFIVARGSGQPIFINPVQRYRVREAKLYSSKIVFFKIPTGIFNARII